MTDYFQDDIHLALVATNSKMAINNEKSIMFHYRKSYNITFYIFTDSDREKTISTYSNSTTNF
jgi:hypothetical protein